ncbi:MAG TPA: methyl-accepting chemotaxis protein [Burkholderiaceae bacterium]|nr:methyl-accepting chemotaxis protein [Burkholderiaceae bacterium]
MLAVSHLEGTTRPRSTHNDGAPKLSGDLFGALINLSGRRRFASQRVVLFAILASQDRPCAIDSAREALSLFSEAHKALVEGNEQLPGVFCEELEEVYFGAAQGDKTIRDFIAAATQTLDAIGQASARPQLDRLVRHATPLLAVLDAITQVYEDLAKRHARRVKQQVSDVLGDIESIARQARMVAFNAQVVAARAGELGHEFSVVAGQLTQITGRIDELVKQAMRSGA